MSGGGRGAGAKGAAAAAAPSYARNPPRDGVLYDELEVHWGATARYVDREWRWCPLPLWKHA